MTTKKVSAEKKKLTESSKKLKRTLEADPSGSSSAEKSKLPESSSKKAKKALADGFGFVGEPVPVAEARERWPERYENKVWIRCDSFVVSSLSFALFFLIFSEFVF